MAETKQRLKDEEMDGPSGKIELTPEEQAAEQAVIVKRVSAELVEAATVLAAAFERVPDEALTRTGRRSDGARFTTETLGRYFIHDPVHHLWDVTRSQ